MEILLGPVTLKSGETAEIWQIVAPAPAWKERILPFLAHKGDPWLMPMEKALTEGLPGLRMNFFECLLGEQIVGNITTVDAQGVGMLQHVFTDPAHRRKGICQALMQAATEDFARRGGRAMYLGTGYESPPFWIYYSFGFRPIGQTGAMKWLLEPEFERKHFASGPTIVRDTAWPDWPQLTALYQTEEGDYLRGMYFQHYGHSSFEGAYAAMQRDKAQGRILQVKVLEKEDGALVGHAMLAVQSCWRGEPYLLDFFVHPHFGRDAAKLVQAFVWPTDKKIQCFCETKAQEKRAALAAAGFRQEAVLKRQILRNREWLDVVIYAKMNV